MKIKDKPLCLCGFFLFLFSLPTYSQSYFGVRAEPIFYSTNIEKEIYFPTSNISKEHSFESNINATLNFSVKLLDNFRLSIRPGFIFGDLYSGINVGIFGSYALHPDHYLISGINTHTRQAWGGHTYSGNDITTPYLAIGYGCYFSKKNPIELQLNFPLNKQSYGTVKEVISVEPYTVWRYYRVAWMLKLSLGFEVQL